MGQSDMYTKLVQEAEKHATLHHFTRIENFDKIISSSSLLLRRLDQMEDKSENEYLPGLWKSKVFAACFTHSNEGKARFWKEYAGGNGVRLSFPNHLLTSETCELVSRTGYKYPKRKRTDIEHKTYEADEDWSYYDISKIDIVYIDPSESERWKGRSNGLAKNCGINGEEHARYNWEEETRIRVAMDPLGWENKLNKANKFVVVTPPFDSVFLRLNEVVLKHMYVSVREGTPAETIKSAQKILAKNEHTSKCVVYILKDNGNLIPV